MTSKNLNLIETFYDKDAHNTDNRLFEGKHHFTG